MWELFQTNRQLADYSTFRIGGVAKYFLEIHSLSQLQEVLAFCQREKLPWRVVGKGSNTLFSDEGFEGLILLNKLDHFLLKEEEVEVGGGFSFSLLGVRTARAGFAGLEFACGIPATVGGALFMNAGAGSNETAHALKWVDFVDERGQLFSLTAQELSFGYRYSSFQTMPGVVVKACFALRKDSNARANQEKILHYRLGTQPYDLPSVGCIFRNPVGACAGALIEQVGLKGKRIGGVEVSQKHANFIVNVEQGTAADVEALIEHVKASVYKATGFQLEEEVRRCGC